MHGLETLITIIHVIVSVLLILVVLLQSGRGGGMGAAFGGAGGQVFGGRGAGNFLAKLTTGCAIIFMGTSLGLSYLSSQQRSVVPTNTAKIELSDSDDTDTESDAAPDVTQQDAPAGD